MRISDWSSDVCSSDLGVPELGCKIAISFDPLLIHFDVATLAFHGSHEKAERIGSIAIYQTHRIDRITLGLGHFRSVGSTDQAMNVKPLPWNFLHEFTRSEEHTSEPQSLMRITYAIFCLKQ